jgi:hypothetical protein
LLFLEEALDLLSAPAYPVEKSLERVLQLGLDVGKALRACRTKGVMGSMRTHTGARIFALYWSRGIEPGLGRLSATLALKRASGVITPLKVFISCLIVYLRVFLARKTRVARRLISTPGMV